MYTKKIWISRAAPRVVPSSWCLCCIVCVVGIHFLFLSPMGSILVAYKRGLNIVVGTGMTADFCVFVWTHEGGKWWHQNCLPPFNMSGCALPIKYVVASFVV